MRREETTATGAQGTNRYLSRRISCDNGKGDTYGRANGTTVLIRNTLTKMGNNIIFVYSLDAQPNNDNAPVAFEEIVEVCKCPKCGSRMALKFINNSYCFSCLNYPVCRHTMWLPGSVIKKATATNRSCAKCGPDFKRVEYTLRSFRHSSVLDQRLMGDDGLTYETCLMCDPSFQDLCDINRSMLSPNAVQDTSIRRAPPTVPRQNTALSQPTPLREHLPPNRPQSNNFQEPHRNRPVAPPQSSNRIPPNNRPSAPPTSAETTEVKCNKCSKVARK